MSFKLKKRSNKKHPETAFWYKLYIRSERWVVIRERLFKQRGKKCELCKSKRNIIVHHLTYEHVTRELLRDLQVLCQSCHNRLPHDSFHVPFIFIIYNEHYINLKRVSWMRIYS